MDYLLLLLGFAALIKSSDFLVDGASSLARRYGMSDYVVGLTVVAFATSLPELVVNMIAVIDGSAGMALGNVLGSNTLNIFVVIGITAAISPLAVSGKKIIREITLTILLSALLLFVAGDSLFFNGAENIVSRTDGAVLLVLFSVFMYFTLRAARDKDGAEKTDTSAREVMSVGKASGLIVIGVAGLFIGGKLIVGSAGAIALSFGMSDRVIGLTVVALGTSMPEIVTSIIAARKVSGQMALGNVLGSNIFNGLFILGLTAVLAPVKAGNDFSPLDLYVTMAGSAVLLLCVAVWGRISRVWGVSLLACYAAYAAYLLVKS